MMERRQFLGAAATLPTLPRVADLGSRDQEQTDDPDPVREGVANTNIGTVASRFGIVERPEVFEEPTFSLGAVHYDDDSDDSVVEVDIDVGDMRIGATLSPEQARALSRQLSDAAKYADEGSTE